MLLLFLGFSILGAFFPRVVCGAGFGNPQLAVNYPIGLFAETNEALQRTHLVYLADPDLGGPLDAGLFSSFVLGSNGLTFRPSDTQGSYPFFDSPGTPILVGRRSGSTAGIILLLTAFPSPTRSQASLVDLSETLCRGSSCEFPALHSVSCPDSRTCYIVGVVPQFFVYLYGHLFPCFFPFIVIALKFSCAVLPTPCPMVQVGASPKVFILFFGSTTTFKAVSLPKETAPSDGMTRVSCSSGSSCVLV